MTPKEKAKQLIENYQIFSINSFFLAKQCALIAVDEILKLHIFKYNSVELFKYWQEVKYELEILRP